MIYRRITFWLQVIFLLADWVGWIHWPWYWLWFPLLQAFVLNLLLGVLVFMFGGKK